MGLLYTSFLSSLSITKKYTNYQYIKPLNVNDLQIINGIDIGIPLNIITELFTKLHYGYSISNFKLLTLQFLVGYYTYGKDRYKDALEYQLNPINTKKQSLYLTLLKYKNIYKFSYCITFYTIAALLFSENDFNNSILILLLLYSTEYYKDLKKKFAILKPFYVSFMWTFATIIMPCILYEHNYNILNDFNSILPCMLILFSTTNLADINDITEDTENNIQTLPVMLGEKTTTSIILLSLSLSSLLFGLHPNYYDSPIINSLFELQNIGLSILCFMKYYNKNMY